MEILSKLPEGIFNKVMLFNSHPCADLIRDNFIRLKELNQNVVHGSAFDRGKSDAYYGRECRPHMWIFSSKLTKPPVLYQNEMSLQQIDDYKFGYYHEIERKWGGEYEDEGRPALIVNFMTNYNDKYM